MRTKLRQIKYFLTHELNFERGAIIVAIVIVLVSINSAISAMSRNWELEQRLNARHRELALLELEIETLELENQYYASEEYQELSARAKQNKKLPGEVMIYLPKNSDIAINKHKEVVVEEVKEEEKSNLEQWWLFLFGA